MRLRHLFAVALLVPIFALPAAAGAAIDAGSFSVVLTPPGMPDGQAPSCTPSLSSIAQTLIADPTKTVALDCSVSGSATAKSASGTVSSDTLAATDPGFARGTITVTCDSSQKITMHLAISTSSQKMTNFAGTVFQACAFLMSFPDKASSSLSGTIEANATLGAAAGELVSTNVDVAMTAQVFVTGGTGLFAGQVGSGSFSQSQSVPVGAGFPSAGAPGASGSTGVTGAIGATGASGSGGPAAPTAAELAVCAAAGVSASQCVSTAVTAICAQVPAGPIKDLCTAAGNHAVLLGARLAPRVSGAGEPMSLKLTPGVGSARLLSPAPPAGKPLATAATSAKTTFKLVATKGATCVVKTNTSAVAGRATSTSSSKAMKITPVAGVLAKATSVIATCKLGKTSFSSQRVKTAYTK